MGSLIDFEQKKKLLEENLKYIKNNLNNGPIFIELMGTPKSGKTTLLKYLNNFYTKNEINISTKQETAEYNPIEDKNSEEYSLWMIMELFKGLMEEFSDETPRIVIYDRGILDRLFWLDVSLKSGDITSKDYMIIKNLYKTNILDRYKPLSYEFITSPEISIERKGRPGRIVNIENIKTLNEILEKEDDFVKSLSNNHTIIRTDKYQGNIKSFIFDATSSITQNIKNKIKEEKNIDLDDEFADTNK